MNRSSITRTAAETFLAEAAKPGGASISGTKPAYVRLLLNSKMIVSDGISWQPHYPGSRGMRVVQTFKATSKGIEKLREKDNG